MNLRNISSPYYVGLDIGTGSVGWAVIDEQGDLCRFKGKPTWGSRIFPSAETAAETRVHRGQRRRYDRCRQRLDLLQGLFAEEMAQTDPEFFHRLNQSRLHPEDRNPDYGEYAWPLFNDEGFDERAYYKNFPTIYHVRKHLIELEEKADIRLIYLAFHNIVKHRGNFLYQDNPSLSARNTDIKGTVERMVSALHDWCEERGLSAECDEDVIVSALCDTSLSAAEKRDAIEQALDVKPCVDSDRDPRDCKKMVKAIAQAITGYKADFAKIFFCESEDGSFSLSNEEKALSFACPDEGAELFESLRAAYSAFILLGILGEANGKTLSYCKVKEYERYGKELRTLKGLVRTYAPEKYDSFFRGELWADGSGYKPTKEKTYTQYNLGTSILSHEDFLKTVSTAKGGLFEGTGVESDPRWEEVRRAVDEGKFLRRLKTSDNGSIPYQLHLEEMCSIIDKQARYYPFLESERKKIESLVTFRIPYYVGPLTKKNAPEALDGSLRFAWSERLPGKEGEKIRPWNWEEIIDKDASAEAFIRRMTGTCTYVKGEPVLPRCSLTYEMFCVLNELNGARCEQGGDKPYRFDAATRKGIVEDLFKRGRSVSYKKVEQWLAGTHGPIESSSGGAYHVSGGQGEASFESKLSSYGFFCNVLGVSRLPDGDISMVEDLILWNTVFEDRGILKHKIKQAYGDRLTDKQIGKICRKRFTGWGRLSRKFLTGVRVEINGDRLSIMDVLAEGNPFSKYRAVNLMEILHDDDLGFGRRIDELNTNASTNFDEALADLPGSPALRRAVRQATRIVDEIASIAGKPPARVFIEVTRDEDARKKGKRTSRRYKKIEEALKSFKGEYSRIECEMKGCAPKDFDDKRLALYFMQCGKCLYSGRSLDINRLGEYQIDHILPQSYMKDDSFENMALVYSEENQRKFDSLLLDQAVINRMKSFWEELLRVGLMGQKKFNNLTRTYVSDDRLKGFINRQLVETSQIVKHVQGILAARYPESDIRPVKASMSHQLREACELYKCRSINDFHHAHDAYLACQVGRFIYKRHEYVFTEPLRMAHVVKKFIRAQGEAYRRTRDMPGSAGFIVSSFLRSDFDSETGEIFQDDWSAEAEVDRIRRCLDYKDCFISRMPEETRGAFWDQTIYSPRLEGKSMSLPLKKGLDPSKYGSYSREQFAYFFIYEAVKGKKGKKVLEFAPVPVSVVSEVRSNPAALESYARKLAADKGLEYQRIARSKVGKYQVIELNGDRLYITGKSEVRNARQFAFTQEETELFCRFEDGEEVSSEETLALLRAVVARFDRYACRLGRQLKADRVEDAFVSQDEATRKKVINSLVSIAAGHVNAIDLSDVGGPKNTGQMKITFSKELSSPSLEFHFVDTSVTGMFERRYRLGL